jgi:hypothetical protein
MDAKGRNAAEPQPKHRNRRKNAQRSEGNQTDHSRKKAQKALKR